MPGPFDYIPAGKKPVLVDGKWSLVNLDENNQEDAVQLLSELRIEVAKKDRIIKELEGEVERLKIAALEQGASHGKKSKA